MISCLPPQNDFFRFFFSSDGKKKRGRELTSAIHCPKLKFKLRKYIEVQLDLTFGFPPRFFFDPREKKNGQILPTYLFLKLAITFICYYL